MAIKAVIYAADIKLAKGLINILMPDKVEAHLFTSLEHCKRYLGSNDVDIIYVCTRDESPSQTGEILKEASRSKETSVLYHHQEEETIIDRKGVSEGVETGDLYHCESQASTIKEPKDADPGPAGFAGRKKILIAEDDLQIAKVVKHKLESMGYEVAHAADGKEAIIKTNEMKPDVVILDVMMPKYTGTEVARMLRLDQKFENLPIIIITASGADEIKDTALKYGADRYIRKPFKLSELVETIQELLNERINGLTN